MRHSTANSAVDAIPTTTTTTTRRPPAPGSVSSLTDSTTLSSFSPSPTPSADANLVVTAGTADSGSFKGPCETPSVTVGGGSDDGASPSQRSQRLLVRIPSTGAVVVIPATALVFGHHKQRGKTLELCAAFDTAQGAAPLVCPDPANCRHVHADLQFSTPFRPHRRSAALLGQYPRVPAGTVERVLSADGAAEDAMPVERMLLTRALDCARRPIPQCGHFLKSVCNRGSECEFAHVVGAAGPWVPALLPTAPEALTKSPKKKRVSRRAAQRSQRAAYPSSDSTSRTPAEQQPRPAVSVAAVGNGYCHHSMPGFTGCTSAPSASSVLSGTGGNLSVRLPLHA